MILDRSRHFPGLETSIVKISTSTYNYVQTHTKSNSGNPNLGTHSLLESFYCVFDRQFFADPQICYPLPVAHPRVTLCSVPVPGEEFGSWDSEAGWGSF